MAFLKSNEFLPFTKITSKNIYVELIPSWKMHSNFVEII